TISAARHSRCLGWIAFGLTSLSGGLEWLAMPRAAFFHLPVLLLLGWGWLAEPARATPDLRFDVVTFCCNCTNTGSMMCQPQFDPMNFPPVNGHFLAMGDDPHRFDLQAIGNVLAIYFNTLNDGWTTNTGASSAA